MGNCFSSERSASLALNKDNGGVGGGAVGHGGQGAVLASLHGGHVTHEVAHEAPGDMLGHPQHQLQGHPGAAGQVLTTQGSAFNPLAQVAILNFVMSFEIGRSVFIINFFNNWIYVA